MADLQAGMLLKMLDLIEDPEARVAGHHRSVLLRIIGIVPALSATGVADDDEEDEDEDQLWRPNLGFHLRVSDASHSLYVTIPPEDEERCELVLNGELQLGHFIYAERLEINKASPYPRLVGMKLLPAMQKTQSSSCEELQRITAMVENIPQESLIHHAISIAMASRTRRSSRLKKDTGDRVSKWEVSANSVVSRLRPSKKQSFHDLASVKAPNVIASSSPSLCNKKERASPSENRNPNISKKESMASSDNQRSGHELWKNNAKHNNKINRSISVSTRLSLGLKLSDHLHEKKVELFTSDSALENSSSKKTKNAISMSRPVLNTRSPYNNRVKAIANNPSPSDEREGHSKIFNRAFLFEKTPVKKTQLSSRRSSSYGCSYGDHYNNKLSSTSKKHISQVMENSNSSKGVTEGLAIAPATREIQKDSLFRERKSLRIPSPNRVRSSEGVINNNPARTESNGLASIVRKSCSAGIPNRPQAPSSSAIAKLSSSSSAPSALRSSRKGWDLRPVDSLMPRRSVDMVSSRFSSAPRSSKITHPSTPPTVHGSSKTQIKAENVRASQSISSKSSQISLSISCRNQGRNGEDRRLSPITGAKIKSVIASDSVPSPSTIHQKNYTFSALSDNKNSRVMIHDKRWTDGSVSWDPISPSLAGLAKEIAGFKRTASYAAAQALQEASIAESVLRNVSIFAELCSQSRPESPREAMENYFNFHRSLQLATAVSKELAKSYQKDQLSSISIDGHSLDIDKERGDTTLCYKEKLQCAASWVSAALATDLVQVNEYAHQSNVESMKTSKTTRNSIKASQRDSITLSETKGSMQSSEIRGSIKAAASEVMKKSQVLTPKASLPSPGRLFLRPASPITQRRMSHIPVNTSKMSVKNHSSNRIISAPSSGEIINDVNKLSRKDAVDIVSSLISQSSSSHECPTQSGLILNGPTTHQERVKAESIADLARQLQTESQKWFFNYMEKALDCGFKFLYSGPSRKESKPYSNNLAELGLSDNEALASAFPHLKQLNDWIGKLDYGTLDAKMLEVLSRLKKKICHFLLQHIKTISNSSSVVP